ncbi:helix-turn-helix domain-containing protein [Amaricoccus macauensis]|uniref:helix-turn-helix domain-containing protein n=1 Tax=Amaricoccus macauensis TaxID=57001 RepID=UPI003C7A9B97
MPESSILTKAMALMDLVTEAETPLNLAEITYTCGWPRSSVHRLLVLLRDADVLSCDPEWQTYDPGSRLMRWEVRTQTRHHIARIAAPHMKTLCRATKLRVALSVLDARSVLFIHTEEVGLPFRLADRTSEARRLCRQSARGIPPDLRHRRARSG